MAKGNIDFKKVTSNAKAVAEPIPAPGNVHRPTPQPATPEPEKHEPHTKPVGRPSKGPNYHYSRVAIEKDVWLKMGYTKVETGENFTEQINNALRQYLGLTR